MVQTDPWVSSLLKLWLERWGPKATDYKASPRACSYVATPKNYQKDRCTGWLRNGPFGHSPAGHFDLVFGGW